MVGIYKESKETKTYTKKTLVRTECDRCGAEIPPEGPYNVKNLDIRFSEGTHYPESGSEEGWQVEDLCDVCVDKLKALLKKWGAKIVPYETDW